MQLAELCAIGAEQFTENKEKALRRTSRKALQWPEEAAKIASDGRSLRELDGVGPWVAAQLDALLNEPPEEIPEPPPIRAGFESFAASRELLATEPARRRDIKGDLQMHTRYSDGRASIRDMANSGIELGYDYIAITDHSKGLKIAGGMDEDTLANQGAEIDDVNGELDGFRVLKALEMNVSPDGSGDMEPDALLSLDLVLGSFHSKLRIKEDQTERYLSALRNPYVHVLGHPRGRIFNFRLGLSADWPRVFEEAAALDKAVEIDGFPYRQDLNVGLLELARESGVRISIGTDAHNEAEMQYIEVGAAAALAAGIPTDRILNYKPADEILAWTDSLKP
ncbi:MAG: putative hydrolase [Actinomycetota bacterium]|nr:putative hydrolase [Actinomycetota bacterium]